MKFNTTRTVIIERTVTTTNGVTVTTTKTTEDGKVVHAAGEDFDELTEKIDGVFETVDRIFRKVFT